jgi:hypothetical protein
LVEAGDLVGHFGARRQKQNRYRVAVRAQFAHYIQATAAGQHEIEDEQVVARRQCPAESGAAVVLDINLVVLGFEPTADEAGDLLLIFDDEDVHRFQ